MTQTTDSPEIAQARTELSEASEAHYYNERDAKQVYHDTIRPTSLALSVAQDRLDQLLRDAAGAHPLDTVIAWTDLQRSYAGFRQSRERPVTRQGRVTRIHTSGTRVQYELRAIRADGSEGVQVYRLSLENGLPINRDITLLNVTPPT